MRVAIIGAGAGGLVAARTFLRSATAAATAVSVTLFEKSDRVGGIWNYDPTADPPTPMYAGLRTNLPKELMQYRSFPFPKHSGGPSYVSHSAVAEYLHSYATENDLLRHIKFCTAVTSVNVVESDGGAQGETFVVESAPSGCSSSPGER